MSEKTAKAARGKGKMWKIDLRPYKVEVAKIDGNGQVEMKGGRPVMTQDDFDVRGSMASILFNAELKLGVDDTFKHKDLADAIREADGYILVDGAELMKLQSAYQIIKGIPENQLEFFARIRDAEEVGVEEVSVEAD